MKFAIYVLLLLQLVTSVATIDYGDPGTSWSPEFAHLLQSQWPIGSMVAKQTLESMNLRHYSSLRLSLR